MENGASQMKRKVLWWGRADIGYSRNVVIREAMTALGFELGDFRPRCSKLGGLEALLKRVESPDAVWVGCFRQRDVAAAASWAHRRGIPVVFDPLISQYDKAVNEFKKFSFSSAKAKRLLKREQRLFSRADIVVADTVAHADYFHEVLGVPREKIKIIYVGADSHFVPAEEKNSGGEFLRVLFYGSFLPLQGPGYIVEAARLTAGSPVRWTLVGDGPEKPKCLALAKGLDNIVFKDHIAYKDLPSAIAGYDVVLGVFGDTEKAARVMPNKFFQALACGKAVVTMRSRAYPAAVAESEAVKFVDPGNPRQLADAVLQWCYDRSSLVSATAQARRLFEYEFGSEVINSQVAGTLNEALFR